jgi:eukaryotic-like serine/threonine-protein kinase
LAVPAERLKFGDCEFDQRSGELWRDGDSVVLANQPFRILAFLLHRPGILVTRDELARELWPEGTFVDFEHSLNAGVRRLREAIGDSAAAPRFIETIPQRGYRFIANVEARVSSHESLSAIALPGPAAIEPIATNSPVRARLGKWPVIASALPVAVLLVVAFYAPERRSLLSASASARTLVRLTSASGLNIESTISPDGTHLAFASDRGGSNLDIYAQFVSGGEPVQLTSNPADDSEPSFSPDGAHIVFSRRGSGLYVVGALGGEARLIVRAEWARTPRFSPDGRWISYWTGFPASVVAGGIPGALGSIYVVPFDGRTNREIRTHLASARYPIWSPDGKSLLFLGEEDSDRKTHDWYVIPVKGGTAVKTNAVPALHSAGLRTILPIPGTWTAKHHAVVFATNETDSSNVWQIAISPVTKRVDGSPERLTFGSAIERSPIITSTGRIVFTSLVENVDIWRVPIDEKTGQAAGPMERLTDDASSDRLRSVSADGRTVVFISSRTKRDEVWTKDVQTGRERQLTYTGVIEAAGSADGSHVAFSTNDGGRSRIEIIDTADGAMTELCKDCDAPASWSPDGKRLLYRRSTPVRVLEYDFKSHRQSELLRHPTWGLDRSRFTPDGRAVTFHAAKSPNVRQIYTARLTGTGSTPPGSWVPVVMDHGCHPSWSATGRQLYHFSFRDGSFCPWVQDVDTSTNRPIGAPRAVVHLHHPRLRATSGAAAFEDVQAGYLYMTLTESAGNIWMIDTPP